MLGFSFYVNHFLEILEKIINVSLYELLRDILIIVLPIVESIDVCS